MIDQNQMAIYRLDYMMLRFSDRPKKIFDGLTSNTMDSPKNAFIDNIGRTIAAFYQLQKEEDVYILIHKKYYQRLMDHLDKFLKLTKVKVERKDHSIYFCLDKDDAKDAAFIFADGLMATEKTMVSCDEDAFNVYRLKHGIPLPGIDFDNELILNVSEEFISFKKGCYLGQEIIARVKYLGKAPKKLAIVKDGKKMTSVANVDGENKGFAFIAN
ncbi:MAG: tRNA-modifying protein YgfZ [Candidatus Woesearchaeota archaeon]|nr:tRNA-modifying protein YgfZ [Candidatus Woesearchaeota archaeon]